ncbi:NRDE family protein [Luteimonas yindakuii]|uniref:NRDE family protein n=1 Tax=Luteimonas yindakuii TaxID=2565782 RepID=UPI0011078D5C|nr:NRDE family protein [Luteimonas yindakuii]QCO67483.2 NRDE family protein [Luteimonas yindakuii]
MCLVALAYRLHPRWPLVLIANRDEAHARATAPAGFDPDAGDVYGGRDLVAGGSWLQVSTRGRLAAVTNVRRGLEPEQARHSRGWLVRDFVRGNDGALAYAEALQPQARAYGRFNLLMWDGDTLGFASNVPEPVAMPVAPGLHAMSNGAFDASWPKSAHATRALAAWLDDLPGEHGPAATPDTLAPLFDALADTAQAPDERLPDTGIGLALERRLSPAFIRDPVYGTRSSSVVLADAQSLVFAERRFGPDGAAAGASFDVLARTPQQRAG